MLCFCKLSELGNLTFRWRPVYHRLSRQMSRVCLANYERKGAVSEMAFPSAIFFVYLCVYDLFSDAVSSSEFVASNVTVISE
jgi:hypothetical protein